ncbi:hypothetical protein I8748_21875 [Nostoc sp. CENA67]|uniref:Uncharacterized protein n=1 Tax=Amazonocrinis nigriterrae CENA67 TaxID=2794033 RepID=A0A8J7L8T4_9NOST|nr:hypothetical protein [Amazonocrinis nigriterrae]MBH8564799.1 hypothetical protein [Amazonocrinis nigriterrae CENA67]
MKAPSPYSTVKNYRTHLNQTCLVSEIIGFVKCSYKYAKCKLGDRKYSIIWHSVGEF